MEDDDGSSKRKKLKQSVLKKKRTPNILITGTPGVGKSTLCKKLADSHKSIKWINIGDFAHDNNLLGEFDETYGCHEVQEDDVIDRIEEIMSDTKETAPTVLIDHHVTDFFPERWFDIVFVLRTNNTLLYDRLAKGRGYSGKKLKDNIECEIFQTILDEARDSYAPEIVHELKSECEDDIQRNAERIRSWIKKWMQDNNLDQ